VPLSVFALCVVVYRPLALQGCAILLRPSGRALELLEEAAEVAHGFKCALACCWYIIIYLGSPAPLL